MDKRTNLNRVKCSNGLSDSDAELVGRRVTIALLHGNREWAHAIIDSVCDREDVRTLPREKKLDLPVAMLWGDDQEGNLIQNELWEAGIYTVRQLLATRRETLLERPNFGPARLERVLAALHELGF